MSSLLTRRRLLTLAAPAVLLGCDTLGRAPRFHDMVLKTGEWLSYRSQRLLGSESLAREFDPSQMSPEFRTNGSVSGGSPAYKALLQNGFADWSLPVTGLVNRPLTLTLADLRARPARTQITRHDCVEGWSAIGKWTGAPLGAILKDAGVMPAARYVVFQCYDTLGFSPYYESIDLVDAFHPQTLLAYDMNDAPLTEGHGAPVRLRVERQLGYKQAKFIKAIDVVDNLAGIGMGKGGYWEDQGDYDWYAGI